MVYGVVRGPVSFSSHFALLGGPWCHEATLKTLKFSQNRDFYYRPKSYPNPLPMAQNGPKYVS